MTSLPDFMCPACSHSIDTHSLGEPCHVGGICECVLTPRDIVAHLMVQPGVSATLVKVGVFMGDHAETIRTAVQIEPDETVDALARRLLKRSHSPEAERDWYVEIRMVVQSEVGVDV